MKYTLIYSNPEGTTICVGSFDDEGSALAYHESLNTSGYWFFGIAPVYTELPS